MSSKLFGLAGLAAGASATTIYSEDFSDGWDSRWAQSTAKDDLGTFVSEDGGIKTSQDAKFYGLATSFPKVSNEGKTFVVQYRVKHAQNIDCGGGYVKIFPSTQEPASMDGESAYNIMFGPDICGYSTKKVHVIFGYKGQNLLTKKDIPCESDELSHLYTLIVNPDNTYEVRIDGEKKHDGSLYDDFDFLAPKEINDPAVSKPEDWVDETHIDDPEDTKPADWVDETHIADPEAEKPEDWDDEMDGEWEAPQIDNPDYKGAWSAKRIENPAYKGEWVHPQVANPDFVDDEFVYKFDDFGAIGFDLWQVKSGTIFDDLLITDSVEEAEAAVPAFNELAAAEKKAKEEADAAAAKAAEEAAAAAEAEKEDEAGDEEAADEEAKDEL